MSVSKRERERETSWPSAAHSIPYWTVGKYSFSPFSDSFFNFLFSLHMNRLPSLLLLLPLLYNICVCTQLCALIAGVTHFRRAFWVGLFIPVCLCRDSGRPLIFKHPLIQIQKLVFPPLSAGSLWDRFGTAHHANEASFMDAANDGFLAKSMQIGIDAEKCAALFFSCLNIPARQV